MTGSYHVLLQEMSYNGQWILHSVLWKPVYSNISSIKFMAPILNVRFCLAVTDFMSKRRLYKNSSFGLKLHQVVDETHINWIQGG